MGLESSRLKLLGSLRAWGDDLAGLETMLADHPVEDSVVLIDDLGDAVLETRGWIEDAIAEARQLAAIEPGVQLTEGGRQALPKIHRSLHAATQSCLTRFGAAHCDYELRRLARIRGGEWSAWIQEVRKALATHSQPICVVGAALLECWCDLLDRAGSPLGVRQTVTIYQADRINQPVGAE
jgi:hypothetical protein